MQVCKASHSCICVKLTGLCSLQFYPVDVASNTLEIGSVFFSSGKNFVAFPGDTRWQTKERVP